MSTKFIFHFIGKELFVREQVVKILQMCKNTNIKETTCKTKLHGKMPSRIKFVVLMSCSVVNLIRYL